MNLLILHPNFPAQFKEPAIEATKLGWNVKFVCQTHYGRSIPKVERIKIKGRLSKEYLDNHKLEGFERTQEIAIQYRLILDSFKKENYRPDVIISHSGWGVGLFAKELWPDSYLISYFEWWYKADSYLYRYDTDNKWLNYTTEAIASLWKKNQSMALEMASANFIATPSMWQRNQLPQIYQKITHIIEESIESDIFEERENKKISRDKNNIKLTYGTRGFEPIRCFSEFINELPSILAKFNNIDVSIAGSDMIFYGGKNPVPNDKEITWKKWAVNFLTGKNCMDRVSFVGSLPRKNYIEWLGSSDIHVYLTQPYIASWSLKDALILGKNIIGSDTPPVQEYYSDQGMTLVDHRKPGFLLPAVEEIVKMGAKKRHARAPSPLARWGKGAGWKDVLVHHVHT